MVTQKVTQSPNDPALVGLVTVKKGKDHPREKTQRDRGPQAPRCSLTLNQSGQLECEETQGDEKEQEEQRSPAHTVCGTSRWVGLGAGGRVCPRSTP